MISLLLRSVTGVATDDEAWKAIFSYYGARYENTKENDTRP